jgi:hypothetical protein
MSNGVNLLGGRYLLQALGLGPMFFDQLEQFGAQLGALGMLSDQFQATSGDLSALRLASMLQGGIPGRCMVASPNMGSAAQTGWAMPQTIDLGASPGSSPIGQMLASSRGAMFERLLRTHPHIRQQFEMQMGGRMIDDGIDDGKVSLMPFSSGVFPAGGGDPYTTAMGLFGQMGSGMFQNMMLGALANLAQQAAAPTTNGNGNGGGAGTSPYVDWADAGIPLGQPAQALNAFGIPTANGGIPGLFPGGNGGLGDMFQPGAPSPTQGAFGMPASDGSDVSGILNDSSLTVEDKVCLMIMAIMKQEDQQIEAEANYINQLQQQQNQNGGKGGKGGGGSSSPSIDVETMKLKRMIDKRSQMFDMLRQIIDKYNQTAKGIIDSMR